MVPWIDFNELFRRSKSISIISIVSWYHPFPVTPRKYAHPIITNFRFLHKAILGLYKNYIIQFWPLKDSPPHDIFKVSTIRKINGFHHSHTYGIPPPPLERYIVFVQPLLGAVHIVRWSTPLRNQKWVLCLPPSPLSNDVICEGPLTLASVAYLPLVTAWDWDG